MDDLSRVEIHCLNGKFLQLLAKTPVLHILSASPDSLKIIELKDASTVELLAKTPVLHILSTSPDSLKIIELKDVNFINFDKISAIVCLIRSAPNLHKLHIGVNL
ncbi:hypothetical protein HAX54_042075, partial [Datura stramonium]|nr:hypothetical protein [Datura stramonium]